ncbi:preprotein translocase subunit SecG [Candidatus Dependentiae bacterium]|nr:preprotein translocase subunit SecG [Candidatus Dependentiae bacterium]
MIFGLLVSLYIVCCLFLMLLVLIQKGKGSMGLGNLGGGTQLLFGGSGGQDMFQKMTWVLGAIFMGGSLFLSLYKASEIRSARYLTGAQSVTWQQPSL